MIIFLLIIVFFLPLHPTTLHFFSDFDTQWKRIEQTLPHNFVVNNLIVTCDFNVDMKEIHDLMYYEKTRPFTPELLRQGFLNLQRKQKFSSVSFSLENSVLTLDLQGVWTIRRIISKGSLLGKEQYKRYYQYLPGDLFERDHHEEALKNMKDALQSEGYCNVTINSEFVYHQDSKEIDIILHIKPGKHFIIKKIVFNWQFSAISDDIKNQIESHFNFIIGTYYSRETIQNECDHSVSTLKSNGIINATINFTKAQSEKKPWIDLSVTIARTDVPLYDFEGNTFFTKGQLLAALAVCDTAVPWLPLSIIIDEISDLYKAHGFLDVSICIINKDEGHLISIDEGKRARISSVSIEGMQGEESNELRQTIVKHLLHKSYNNGLIEQCYDQITAWYLNRGFWDIQVKRHQTISDEGVALVFTIAEGKQRLLAHVTINNDDYFDHDAYFASFRNMVEPIPFGVNVIAEQQHYIKKVLRAQGMLFGNCIPHIIEKENAFELQWELRDIIPLKFGKTIIVGCSRLPVDLIKRELLFTEGDTWSDDALTQSIQRLRSLGLFDSVSITPADLFSMNPEKHVIIRIAESESFEIRTRCGAALISKNATLKGGFTYQLGSTFLWKNPCRRGDILRIDGNFNRYILEAHVSYFIPWCLGKRHNLKVQAYASYYEQPFVAGSREILYHLLRINASAQTLCARNWGEISTIDGFEIMRLSGLSKRRAEVLQFEPELINKFIPYFHIEPTIFFDFLDNKLSPHRGSLTVCTIRGMFPLVIIPHSWYAKVLFDQSFFVSLLSQWVIAFRLRLGHIFHAVFENILPSERFYLGGPHSIRSYQPDLAPPLSHFNDEHGKGCWVPIGGKTMINANIELRFPIFRKIGGVVFSDLGALSQNTMATLRDSFLTAIGFGLRYETPVGPIRFDFGWTVGTKVKSYAWYLALGNSF